MKYLMILTLFISTISVFSEEFRFQAVNVSEFTDVESYDDEVLNIGGMEITRGELNIYAGVNIDSDTCSGHQIKSILDNRAFEVALNATLTATILHTIFQADKDKQMHAAIGSIIGVGTVKICEKILSGEDNRFICALTGAGAALLAGIAKEVYDSKGYGNVEVKDAVYTFVPGALVSFKFSL